MRKIILALLFLLILGCSSDNSSDNSKAQLPEKFDIKIELLSKSSGSIPNVLISVNSLVVKQWKPLNFPFQEQYIYYTKGNEVSNTACKCITISTWAYISKLDSFEAFNLYINGELVATTKVAAPSEPNGTMNPTKLEFVYNP